jgi:predicted outer membrane protein
MQSRRFLSRAVLLGSITLVLAASAAAQAPRRDDRAPARPGGQVPAPRGAEAGQDRQRTNPNDQLFATCLLFENENEVELAKIAASKAKDDGVRKFAQQMQEDHQQMIKKLSSIAGTHARPRTASRNPSTDGRPDGAAERRTEPQQSKNAIPNPERRVAARVDVDNPALQAGPMIDPIALKQELAQQCLQSAQRELDQKEGSEFDHCYMHQQIAAHMQALDTMEVFKRHATGELSQLLGEGIPVVKEHLAHAKQIVKQLEDSASSKR